MERLKVLLGRSLHARRVSDVDGDLDGQVLGERAKHKRNKSVGPDLEETGLSDGPQVPRDINSNSTDGLLIRGELVLASLEQLFVDHLGDAWLQGVLIGAIVSSISTPHWEDESSCEADFDP